MSIGIRDLNSRFYKSVDLQNAKFGKDLALLEGLNDETSFIVEKILEYSEKFDIDLEKTKVNFLIKKILRNLLDSDDDIEHLIAKNFQSYRETLKAKKLSTIDCLTQIGNRKILEYEIEKQIEIKNRNNVDFSILLLDIDNFKKVNDTYGHLAGDEILKKLATVLKDSCRKYDTVGRRGGEEFMVIFPLLNVIDATDKAEQIREIIENTMFSDNCGTEIKITVSIGVTQVEVKQSNKERIIRKADVALYKCKDIGRNKVLMQLDNPEKICNKKCKICKLSDYCIENINRKAA